MAFGDCALDTRPVSSIDVDGVLYLGGDDDGGHNLDSLWMMLQQAHHRSRYSQVKKIHDDPNVSVAFHHCSMEWAYARRLMLTSTRNSKTNKQTNKQYIYIYILLWRITNVLGFLFIALNIWKLYSFKESHWLCRRGSYETPYLILN